MVFCVKMLLILTCLATFLAILIGFAWHRSLYWRRRSIPGPDSQLFIGNLAQLGHPSKEPMPFKLAEWTKKFGSTYGIQRGCCNALVTSDYELARQVFHDQFENFHERDLVPLNGNSDKKPVTHVFASRGLRWKRLRTLMSLVFTTKSLKRIFPTIVSCAGRMIENLDKDLASQSVIDVSRNLKEYTADIILNSAFGRHESRSFIQNLITGVMERTGELRGWMLKLSWICPKIGRMLGELNRRTTAIFNKPLGGFFQQMMQDVHRRKKEKELAAISSDQPQPTDFIDLLMEAESDEVVLQNNDSYSKKNSQVEKRLTVHEIVGSCIVFLIAGFDTTASTLAFTFYYLAKNPEIQDKLRSEIEEICPNEDLDYDSLTKLKYCDAVFQEALRLRPIAAGITSRRCAKTTKIGQIEIEKGTDIIFDVITMQRDKKVFGEDAEEFRPERWLSDTSPQANFLGFGDGLRSCVGMRLAYLKQRVALVKLMRRYRVQEVAETKEAENITGLIMGPRSVKVKLERI